MSNNSQQPLTLVESLTAFAQAIGRDIKEIKDLIKGRPAQGGQETGGSQVAETAPTAPTTKPAEGGLQVFTVIPSKHFANTNFLVVEPKDGVMQVVNRGIDYNACLAGFTGCYDYPGLNKQSQTVSFNAFNGQTYTNDVDVYSDNYDAERAKFIEFLKTDRSSTDNPAYVDFLNNKIVYNPATQSMVFHYSFDILSFPLMFANAVQFGESGGDEAFNHTMLNSVLFEFEENCPKPTILVTQYLAAYDYNEHFSWWLRLVFDTDGKMKLSAQLSANSDEASQALVKFGIDSSKFSTFEMEQYNLLVADWIFHVYDTDSESIKTAKRDVIRAVQRTYHGSIVLM